MELIMAIDLIETKLEMIDAAVKDNLRDELLQSGMVSVPGVEFKDILHDAVAVIAAAVTSGHNFETKEMDVFVEAMLHVLPPSEREWFREIATMNSVPLWQALWAQYRRNAENSCAQTLILDPDWQAYGIRDMGEMICEFCDKPYEPIAQGQRFCSNKCGSQAELAAKRALPVVVEDVESYGDPLR
jgi:hypothetical protein